MELSVAMRLIEAAFSSTSAPQAWVDLGSGSGLFSQALAGLLPAGSTITAIDKDAAALKSMDWPEKNIALIRTVGDFTNASFALPLVDGILMANALHFAKTHIALLTSLRKSLKPGGKFILIEYNMDTPNN